MNNILTILTLSLSFSLGDARAADTPAVDANVNTLQQNKIDICNKEAASKKDNERKAFINECLSVKIETTANKETSQSQQETRKALMQRRWKETKQLRMISNSEQGKGVVQ